MFRVPIASSDSRENAAKSNLTDRDAEPSKQPFQDPRGDHLYSQRLRPVTGFFINDRMDARKWLELHTSLAPEGLPPTGKRVLHRRPALGLVCCSLVACWDRGSPASTHCMILTIVSSRPLFSPLFVFSETIRETFGVYAGEIFRFSSTEVPTRVSRSIVRITFLCSCRQNLSTITDAHSMSFPPHCMLVC